MTIARLSKFDLARDKLGPLTLSERILLSVSKHPDDVDETANYEKPTDQWTVGSALSPLEKAFSGFAARLKDKTVLDYGCGDGFQSVAMAKAGARFVLGVEIEENRLRHAEALATREGVENARFASAIDGKFDAVISLNAMEHFVEPEKNIQEMSEALKGDGKLYLSFGPLWMAPYGHHMYFFTQAPWIKMFHRLVDDAGLVIESIRYRTSGSLPFIVRIPVVREFLVNIIDATLTKRPN